MQQFLPGLGEIFENFHVYSTNQNQFPAINIDVSQFAYLKGFGQFAYLKGLGRSH